MFLKVVLFYGALLGLAGFAMASEGGVQKAKILGGASEEKPGDARAQAVADSVKPKIQEKLGGSELKEFVVEKYSTQVVAGANYFLKIRIAPGIYIHARVLKPLMGAPNELHGLEKDKQAEDKIGYMSQSV